MITNAKKVLAGIAALAALALGGSAIAGAGEGGSPQSENDAAAQAKACNAAGVHPRRNVQYDDETGICSLDTGGNDKSEKEKGGNGESEKRKEVREDDGSGGHEDNPQDPNADHQFEGEE